MHIRAVSSQIRTKSCTEVRQGDPVADRGILELTQHGITASMNNTPDVPLPMAVIHDCLAL